MSSFQWGSATAQRKQSWCSTDTSVGSTNAPRLAILAAVSLDLLDEGLARHDLAEDSMLAIEMQRVTCNIHATYGHHASIQLWLDLAEDNMLAVKPGSLDGADEKLASVGVWTSVGHGKDARAGVLEAEVLVGELLSVNRFTTTAISLGEVTALDHERRNNAVEVATLVVKRLSRFTLALFASAQGTEILHGLGNDLSVKTHDNAAYFFAIGLNIKEHLVGDLWFSRSESKESDSKCETEHT